MAIGRCSRDLYVYDDAFVRSSIFSLIEFNVLGPGVSSCAGNIPVICNSANQTYNSCDIWHVRLGHVPVQRLKYIPDLHC